MGDDHGPPWLWPQRTMAAQQRTLESRTVARATCACQQIDPAARVANFTEEDDGSGRLRLRAGDAHSLEGMREALASALPLSSTRVTESWLDGSMEVEVLVLTRAQERWRARYAVARERLVAYWLVLAWVFVFLGLGEWSASVRGVRGKDEL